MRSSTIRALWFNCIVANVIAATACGDGVAFKYQFDRSTARPAYENEQIAFIAQRDGRQNMLLAVSLELEKPERAVWIVPIPGRPETVNIDVADKMPQLRGYNVIHWADDELDKVIDRGRMLTLLPFLCCMIPSLSVERGFAPLEHAVVEAHGMRVATVTPGSVEELAEYLREHDAQVERASLKTLESYLDQKHVLMVGWLESREKLLADYPELKQGYVDLSRRPAIKVDFPSDAPYFPLVPTSAYGALPVGLRLVVAGHCQLPADWNWKTLEMRWCREVAPKDPEAVEFFGRSAEGVDYTVIESREPARSFTRDIVLTPAKSAELDYALRVLRSPLRWPLAVAVAAFCAYLAGGVVGAVMFGAWRTPAYLGLSILLTLIGMMLVLHNTRFAAFTTRWPGYSEYAMRRSFLVGFLLMYVALLQSLGMVIVRVVYQVV